MFSKKNFVYFLSISLSLLISPYSAEALPNSFTTLFNFNLTNGALPQAGVVQGRDGFFYGTTSFGGPVAKNGCDIYGCGTIFRMNLAGVVTTFVKFAVVNGHGPSAPLTQGGDDYFYGAAARGGSFGYGTVFKMTATGRLTTLHHFNGVDGSTSETRLVQGADGKLYGITRSGGNTFGSACGGNGCGTVFQITPSGAFTNLANFNGSTDGKAPNTFVQGSDGNFYGSTLFGGKFSYGTIFQVSPNGALTTLIDLDPYLGPVTSLILGRDGAFYGTRGGYPQGNRDNNGTVFRMSLDETLIPLTWTMTTLSTFISSNGSAPNGANPNSIIQGSDGNFYGTTVIGGTGTSNYCLSNGIPGCGTVFQMTPSGTITTLVNFDGSNGIRPLGLFEGRDKSFYGTTQTGGNSPTCFFTTGCGTIFKLTK